MSHTFLVPASSSNFRLIFNNALKVYEKHTKKDILAHPFAAQLQACDSPTAILTVLQQQVQEFDQSRSSNEALSKWLDPTVNVLYALSGTLGEGVGLVFSPAKVIFAGVGVLLSAAKDVQESQDTLVDIFERTENFFRRLESYIEVPPTPEMTDIIAKIMAEALTILAIATKEIKQGRTKKYMKKLIGRTEIEDALKRLDRLTHEEARMAAALVLKATHTVDARMRAVDDKLVEVMDDGKLMQSVMQKTADDVNRLSRNQLWDNLHKWLSPPDPSTNHNIACGTHQKRMANWFFQGSIFKGWKETNSLLWIHGKPGSGKSILSSTIIQDIEVMCEAGQASMGYFYFDFRNANKQNLPDLVSSLLTQLSASSDPRLDVLSPLYLAHDRGKKQPSDGVLADCLKQMLSLPDQRPIYLVIDAVDECPNSTGIPSPRERVLQLIRELVEHHIPKLHICVTSRPEVDIRDVIDPLTSCQVSLHDQSGQKEDIVEYVRSVVYSDSEAIMKRWRTEDKDLVVEILSERADGMFRWVFCQLEALRHCLPSSVRRTLEELPESLDETYERVLREIKKPNRDHAHRLLQCLVVAIRPLRIQELAEVLAVDFDDDEGIPKLKASWRWDDQEQALLSSCSSLIAIVDGDSKSRVVQFSHFSVKEFLTSPRLAAPIRDVSRYHIVLEPAHTIMAQACLSVLLRSDHSVEGNGVRNSSPLAQYASEHWVTHAQFQNVSPHLRTAMECLFDPDKPYFASWIQLHDIDTFIVAPVFSAFSSPSKSDATPLYYAALCGFQDLVEHLIVKCPQYVNANGGYYETPVVAALAGRHFKLARLLHRHGSSVDPPGREGQQSPLFSASSYGDLEMVRVLLEYGADVNSRNCYDTTPLVTASYRTHPQTLNVVQFLLENGANPNARCSDGTTPLHAASRCGSPEVVRLLLEYGVDVEAKDVRGRSPFRVALKNGRHNIMELLLGHGAKGI